jgi:glycosyltransferase involved in cell wall biosynthesis
MKKKILLVNEFSELNTGFSVIGKEILSRLYKTDKYDIAELATYSEHGDPRHFIAPWKVYPGTPHPSDKAATHFYQANYIGQFGAAVFDKVVLDYKPDVVITWMDPFMVSYINDSPYRDKFKFLVMACVDSRPQQASWLDFYARADKLIGYAKYTKTVLEEELPERLKVDLIARPGVDTNVFKPLNKLECRKELGLPEDANILLTVMRNQRRKLFPDLIEMFRDYLKRYEDKNTYLYLHTSYPDVGFDIARHVMQSGVSHRILTTYMCENCKFVESSHFRSEISPCKRCGELAAHMPNTSYGVNRETLAKIHNIADLYIQYSIAGALEMPICEAKACGVPALAVDYAAMSEQVEIEGCDKIKVGKTFHEAVIETEQVRALPDHEDAIAKVRKFFQSSKEDKQKWSKIAQEDAQKYSFDQAATVFEQALDEMEVGNIQLSWHNPKINTPPMRTDFPQTASNIEFVDWCIDNVLGESWLKESYWKSVLIKNLGVGYESEKGNRRKFDRNDCINMFVNRAKNKALWEKYRIKSLNIPQEESIKWRLV